MIVTFEVLVVGNFEAVQVVLHLSTVIILSKVNAKSPILSFLLDHRLT
jgi:cytochrome b